MTIYMYMGVRPKASRSDNPRHLPMLLPPMTAKQRVVKFHEMNLTSTLCLAVTPYCSYTSFLPNFAPTSPPWKQAWSNGKSNTMWRTVSVREWFPYLAIWPTLIGDFRSSNISANGYKYTIAANYL